MGYCKLLLMLSTLLVLSKMLLCNEWSKCSRSCGTGISYRTVPCHGHTDDCTETKREYKVCNTEECPAGSIDFRTKQCQEVEIHSISFNNMSDPCNLMCGLPGEQPVEKGVAMDGTSCGVSHICVAGTCIPMSCDGVLGSDKIIDNCGRCDATKGDCLHVPCNIKKADENEYHVKLSAGSTHINLALKSSACNFLALRDQNKTIYFNQTSSITVSGNEIELCGNKLTTHDPLHKEILIQIQHCEAHEIGCRYYIPVYQYSFFEIFHRSTYIRDYEWVVGENYTACSRTCGTGMQTSEFYCIDSMTQKPANNIFCKHLSKAGLQPLTKICFMPECPYEWKVSNWTPCSKRCGGGIRERNVACIQTISPESVSVNSTACLGEKPDSRETCNNHPCYNHWHKGLYSECSNYCGEGERRRTVICLDACGNKINDSSCSILTKPKEAEKCSGDKCTYKWTPMNWSNCSVCCGEGIQTRTVECQRVADDMVVNESYCIRNITTPKPKTQRPCKGTSCIGKWGFEQWGKCETLACYKEGKQYRNIYCYHGNSIARDHPGIKCDTTWQPSTEKACMKTKGCPIWMVTFGPCNVRCVKMGTLKCLQGNEVVNDSLCPTVKPTTVAICNDCVTPCNHDHNICKFIPADTKDPFFQALLCEMNCCKCKRTST